MSTDISRRTFLCAVAGCAAAAVGGCSDPTHTEFVRSNFREMDRDEVAEVIRSIEEKLERKYGKEVTIGTTRILAIMRGLRHEDGAPA